MPTTLPELLDGFNPELPLSQARTIPNTWYHDPALYERERDKVFAASWQMVGRSTQVAQPSTFLTADIAGEPVIVVRDEHDVLRAFSNVCRHRAAPILNEPCGKASKLRCRYHGWTYDLAGKLRGTPEFDGVEHFPREENGLPLLTVAEWGGMVWVSITPPTQSLEAFLAPLPSWSANRGMEQLKFVRRTAYDLNCNWKVYVDNYLDGGYHVNTVHPGLAGVLDYSEYRATIHGNTSVQTSPIKAASNADPTASKTRTGDAAYWWVYPNFMLNLYSGVMDTNLVLPLGPSRCRVIFDYYFTNTDTEADRTFIEDSIAVAHQVQLEDVQICQEVQHGLNSRSYCTGRFSVKREIAGYYFHQLLARRLRGN